MPDLCVVLLNAAGRYLLYSPETGVRLRTENLLERIAEKQLAPSVSAVQVLEDSCDRLQGWVDVVADGRAPDAGQALDLLQQQIQALEEQVQSLMLEKVY